MKKTQLNTRTTMIVGDKTSSFSQATKITTDALGEEHPSTLPFGEEDFASYTAHQENRRGPFGAY